MLSTLKPGAEPQKEPKAERWFGIVFGVKGADKDVDNYLKVENGKLVPGDSPEWRIGSFFAKICHQLPKHAECLVTYHNGHADKSCSFHGHHWHCYLKARCHPTVDARWGKELQQWARSSPQGEELFLAAQVAGSHALLKHILKHPRVLWWRQGEEIMTKSTEFLEELGGSQDRDDDAVDWSATRLKVNQNVERIKTIKQLMIKHETIHQNILRQRILKMDNAEDDPESDWGMYCTLMATANFEQLFKKAATQMKAQFLSKTIDKLFKLPLDLNNPLYMSVERSMEVFTRWCTHQGFVQGDFVRDIFDVLLGRRPKINTFALQGPPNAGKTFILKSLLPWFRWYGEIRLDAQGYAFAFENAVDVGIIYIDEPVISPVAVEQMKLLMGGEETHVKCKNIGDQLVQKTPVFMTHNGDLARFVSSIDKAAMNERMIHKETVASPFLKDCAARLNPGIWPILYQIHWSELEAQGFFDDSDIPTVEEQIQMENEARENEELKPKRQKVNAFLENRQNIIYEKDKIAQLDGQDDSDSDSEEERELQAEDMTSMINDFVTTVVTNDRVSVECFIENTKDIIDRVNTTTWKFEHEQPQNSDEKTRAIDYIYKETSDMQKQKWEVINKTVMTGKTEAMRKHFFELRDDIRRRFFPSYFGWKALEGMAAYAQQKIDREANTEALLAFDFSQRYEEAKQPGFKTPKSDNVKTPGAPKADRKRKGSDEEKPIEPKSLKF